MTESRPPRGYWECKQCGSLTVHEVGTCPDCGYKHEERRLDSQVTKLRKELAEVKVENKRLKEDLAHLGEQLCGEDIIKEECLRVAKERDGLAKKLKKLSELSRHNPEFIKVDWVVTNEDIQKILDEK